MSSQRYQEFIAERTRLLERIKELEAENAELRKRLGEPDNPVPSASNAMQNMSLQEKMDLFCSLFKGRDDVFARRCHRVQAQVHRELPDMIGRGAVNGERLTVSG